MPSCILSKIHPLMRRVLALPPLRQAYNAVNRARFSRHELRQLEIGPGTTPIPGFEALNIQHDFGVHYIADAASELPFSPETFHLIYASHVLEHIPWYRTIAVLTNWVETLKHGGSLEIWVPNGLKICQAFVAAEQLNEEGYLEDGWFKWNPNQDACLWASGRVFSYGDGSTNTGHPNWHHAIFSPRWFRHCLEKAGLHQVHELNPKDVRGAHHGWINLGFSGIKP